MSDVYFISDLHFGHKNIYNMRGVPGTYQNEEHHRNVLVEEWNKKITKRDVVWILGDVCFKQELLPTLDKLRGMKRIVLGNHDLEARHFHKYADFVGGLVRYKEFWLSHAPIHPSELRGKVNIHGHVHGATLYDQRYFNVCPENIGMAPIALDEIRAQLPERGENG